ncbi:hypothetical protein DENSPDRAFT_446970 [Dentipellis sp. KUC8613]|nr:hypothetical protein DENSPDRAFT_446970 [Dentipellis sp. KUC8613]
MTRRPRKTTDLFKSGPLVLYRHPQYSTIDISNRRIMSLIPALNADCASVILDYLDNSALSAFARTSHAAVQPMRLRLARYLRFTDFELAVAGLTFVQNHSLVRAVRSIIFDTLEEGWIPPLAALIADVLASATNLTRFHANEFAQLALAEPRVMDIVVSSTPMLTHLHLRGLRRANLEAVRGLRKHIVDIISGSAATLQEVSIDGPELRMWLRIDVKVPPCLPVTRLTLHDLAFWLMRYWDCFPPASLQRKSPAAFFTCSIF